MIENEVELTLEKLFTKPAQNPFSYNLNFDNPDKIHDYYYLFEQFKKIFVNGIVYTTDHQQVETESGKTILIDKLKKEEIELIKKYMLSVGVDLVHKEFTLEDKDYYIRSLLYDIEKIKDISIDTVVDWKSQLIKTACIKVKQEKIQEMMSKVKKHPYANYFLNLYKPENNLKDFIIKYVRKENPEILNIIYFEPAKIKDYHYHHRYFDEMHKHIR